MNDDQLRRYPGHYPGLAWNIGKPTNHGDLIAVLLHLLRRCATHIDIGLVAACVLLLARFTSPTGRTDQPMRGLNGPKSRFWYGVQKKIILLPRLALSKSAVFWWFRAECCRWLVTSDDAQITSPRNMLSLSMIPDTGQGQAIAFSPIRFQRIGWAFLPEHGLSE